MSYSDECARCNEEVSWDGDYPEDPEDFLCDPCVRILRLELKARVLELEKALNGWTWTRSDEGKVHDRLTSLVDDNLGYRPTMSIEKLLDALETELPALKAKAAKIDEQDPAETEDQPKE